MSQLQNDPIWEQIEVISRWARGSEAPPEALRAIAAGMLQLRNAVLQLQNTHQGGFNLESECADFYDRSREQE